MVRSSDCSLSERNQRAVQLLDPTMLNQLCITTVELQSLAVAVLVSAADKVSPSGFLVNYNIVTLTYEQSSVHAQYWVYA